MKNIALALALLASVFAVPAFAADNTGTTPGTDVMKGCANMACCQNCCCCKK